MMGGSATTYLWVCFQLSSHYFRQLYSLQFIYSLSVNVRFHARFEIHVRLWQLQIEDYV